MSRIFLVDDHPMMRAGLGQMIAAEADMEVCGEASSAAEAFAAIPLAGPDLVVTDITLPDRSGLELIKDLLSVQPGLKIFVFSMHDEMLYAERVMRAGARGYLMKGSDSEQFAKAIRDILAGDISLSARVTSHILNRMAAGSKGPGAYGPAILTDRELEIFEMLGRGLSTPQIGEILHISPRTVDAHRNNIRLKLSLPDAGALMREAVIWVELGASRAGILPSAPRPS